MVYLITLELNKNKDYTNLINAIKTNSAWWHYIDNTWIVDTTETPSQIWAKIHPHIDEVTDSILIVKIDPSVRSGWLPQKAWDWLNEHKI